jgi:hypothetical protein
MAGQWKAQCMPLGMTEKLDKIDIPKGYELNELYGPTNR